MNSSTLPPTNSRGLYYHLHDGPHALVTVILLTSLAILLMSCTLIGNTLVCLAVILVRKLRSQPANYLLVSLAIADMCVGVFVMPLAFLYLILGRWPFGQFMCDVWTSADVTLCTASIMNLCAISVDRYSAITRPLTYGPKRTSRRMLVYVICVWIMAVFVSFLPPIAFWKPSENGHCAVTDNIGYQIYATMASFYIPATIILAVNYKIFKAARRLSLADKKASAYTSPASSFNKNGQHPSPSSLMDTAIVANNRHIRSASDNFKAIGDHGCQDHTCTSGCQLLQDRQINFIDFDDDLNDVGHENDQSGLAGDKTDKDHKNDEVDRSQAIDKSGNATDGFLTPEFPKIDAADKDTSSRTTPEDTDNRIITPTDPKHFHKELINLSLKKASDTNGPSDSLSVITRQNSDKTSHGALMATDQQPGDRAQSIPRKQSITWAQNAAESRRSSSAQSGPRRSSPSWIQPIDTDRKSSFHLICFPYPVHEESEEGTSRRASRSQRSSFSVSYHFEYSTSDHYCVQNPSSSRQILAHLRSVYRAVINRSSNFLELLGFRQRRRASPSQNRRISRLSIHDHHQPGEYSPKIRIRMIENGHLDQNKADPMHHHPKNRLHHRRHPKDHHPNRHGHHENKSETRALKTLGLIMGCFLLCWIPFFTVTLIRALFCSPKECFIPGWLDSLVLWLGYANSTLNPLLYAKYNKDFRIPFREMLCCRFSTLQSVLRMEDYLETFGGSVQATTSDEVMGASASTSFHRGSSKQSSCAMVPSPSAGGTFVSSRSASTVLVTEEHVTRDISL